MLLRVLLNQFSIDCIALSFEVPPVNCPMEDIAERGSADESAPLAAGLAARTSKTANTIFLFLELQVSRPAGARVARVTSVTRRRDSQAFPNKRS